MRCAVFGCNENNRKGKTNIRYYCFPKDNILRKQWVHFCNRKDHFNPSTARICSAHFTEDDFERNLQFEMGFCRNNGYKLKMGTVPTIQPRSTTTTSSRDLRMKSREKKQTIGSLLTDKPVATDDPEAITIENKNDIVLKNNQEEIIPDNSTNEINQKITVLQQEIEDLKRDKCVIQNNYQKQIHSLEKKLLKSELERLHMERKLREIFTAGQVNKLKNGVCIAWTLAKLNLPSNRDTQREPSRPNP